MKSELFTLLEKTGYTIRENVSDEQTSSQEGEVGCEGTSMDIEEEPEVSVEDQQRIQHEINVLTHNQQLDLNLRFWSMHRPSLSRTDRLRSDYVRYRVEFPHEAKSMETFHAVTASRNILLNVACLYKLPSQNDLQNYLLHEDRRGRLREKCLMLTAFKIIFGAITGVQREEAVSIVPPGELKGHILVENMPRIVQELRATNFVGLTKSRVRSQALKELLSPYPSRCSRPDFTKLIPAVIGLLNQATKSFLGFSYKTENRYRECGKMFGSWTMTPNQLNDKSIINIAQDSLLCEDIQFPGHPPVPLPDVH